MGKENVLQKLLRYEKFVELRSTLALHLHRQNKKISSKEHENPALSINKDSNNQIEASFQSL